MEVLEAPPQRNDSSNAVTLFDRDPSGTDVRNNRGRRSRSEIRWHNARDKSSRLSSISRFDNKQERERRNKIEKENEILLRKILDCHHGVDRERTSGIPGAVDKRESRKDGSGNNVIGLSSRKDTGTTPSKQKRTSHQINTKRLKQKTDYENLLLLQKIQNVKSSNSVRKAFA